MNYLWLIHFSIGIALIAIYYYIYLEVDRSSYPCPDNVTQYSGYITVNDRNVNHYFYWFFESRLNPSEDPLILWLDGGPGCSGLVSMLIQNGPCVMDKGAEVPVVNEFSWSNFANMLYIDQPVGTGFSYSDTPEGVEFDEDTIALELTSFLEAFYLKYPKYSRLPLYIMGYSYAGHFVPLFSTHILKSNSNIRNNLRGIGIGNGWVDPKHHLPSLIDYMHRRGFLMDDDLPELKVSRDMCLHDIDTDSPSAYTQCMDSYFQQVKNISEHHAGRSINDFDVRLPCNTSSNLCYDLSSVAAFLNSEGVQTWLGVNLTWVDCSASVYAGMKGVFLNNIGKDIAFALGKGMKVLLYNGRQDLICNYMGGRRWVEEMVWSRQSKFNSMHLVDWYFRGKIVGAFKAFSNLTLVEIEDAGHMVAMDQPVMSLQVLWHFLHDIPL